MRASEAVDPDHANVQARITFAQLADVGRDQGREKCGRAGDHHFAFDTIVLATDEALQGERGAGHLLGELTDPDAIGGEFVDAPAPIHQFEVQRGFERGDASGHGRMFDAQCARRGGEAAFAYEGGEKTQIVPVEHGWLGFPLKAMWGWGLPYSK